MFSGRMTVALVAAGAAAKKLLPGVRFSTRLTEIDGMTDSSSFERILNDLRLAGDTAGGVVEIRAQGIAAGTGEPFFDSIESTAAHLIFSIPGVKGIEFGAGFAAARSRGSHNNDLIGFKPAPSIAQPQETFDFTAGHPTPLVIPGRHDVCIALRGAVAAEAALAIALADLALRAGNAAV